MKFICSLIVVADIDRSRKLYEKILHQKVVTDFGENIGTYSISLIQRKYFNR